MLSTPPHSLAAERNKQPIVQLLRQLLPSQGQALEIASGSGQHVAWFAGQLPGWDWQPSEADPILLAQLTCALPALGLANLRPPRLLDVQQLNHWPRERSVDLVYCANLLHICPWACSAALLQGSARVLRSGGRLVTYGPYLEADTPTAPSNLAFDQSLRTRNPTWGIRSREALEQLAAAAGLHLQARHAMPAHNLLLVWAHADHPIQPAHQRT